MSSVLGVLLLVVSASGQGKRIGDSPLRSIVGGEEAVVGELPFVAKILYGGSRVGCTGSLIAPDKVLTAGHCVSGYNGLSVGFGNILFQNSFSGSAV